MDTETRFARIGHRGAPREFFENTMASFRRAVELGADAIELDIHLSGDGIPFVHHDPTLPRTAKPGGLGGAAIASTTSGDLRTVRLASGDAVPTLAAVLTELAPKVFIYVELKGGSPELVAEALRPYVGSVAVHSFDHDAIAEMARIAPEVPRGILFDSAPQDLEAVITRTLATDIWPAAKLVNPRLVAEAIGAGCGVITWTVNKASDAKHLAALGVTGICTDDLTIFD